MQRSQMKYHPRIGYTYMPDMKTRVSGPGGGYLLRTNALGFRSDHEFETGREPGTFRVLLFGDSQTAGDGIANSGRYSAVLEDLVPGVQVDNFGLSGTGPDQHLLVHREFGDVQADLVLIAVHVENIRRVARRVVKSADARGEESYYAKPYFELRDGELVLGHVPVPKQAWSPEDLPEEYTEQVYSYSEANFRSRDDNVRSSAYTSLTRSNALAPLRRMVKGTAIRISGFQPLPEYGSAQDPAWLLLRQILEEWITSCDERVLLMPLPHYAYLVDSSDPSDYQARFSELAAAVSCDYFDPLPGLRRHSTARRREMWSDETGHLSARGHEVLAGLLAPVVAGLRDSATVDPPTSDQVRSQEFSSR